MPTKPPGARLVRAPRTERIGMLGTYPPRLCGLATFAAALEREFLAAGRSVTIIAVDGRRDQVVSSRRHELRSGSPDSVRAAARTLSRCDVAIVQHEYGIYGGPDGDEVIDVLRLTTTPAIVVLHTVPLVPTDHQKVVLETVCELAAAVVVMTRAAGSRLADLYAVDQTKVTIIPHGAWNLGADRAPTAACSSRTELLTWGLLGPGKGIEHMVGAMALLTDVTPHVRYTVAGATHPNVFAREADKYRQSLIRSTWATGVAPSVRFDDSYRDVTDLFRVVASASLVVLPYDSIDQVTSGVLVDAIAAGRPVIATAFPHAVELLSGGAGMLVPHGDVAALAAAVRHALCEPSALASMTARAREIAPTLEWGSVGARYLDLCETLETAAQLAEAVG